MMKTADFDYELPQEYIAQQPLEPRDSSRLLVLGREDDRIEHVVFNQIGRFLRPMDVLVINQTRVIPARIYGHKVPTGGKVEILLLKKRDDHHWETLVGGKGLNPGKHIQLENGLAAEIVEKYEGARRLVRFSEPVEPSLEHIGHMPLPPYIHETLKDPSRYQTIYADQPGSAAAPTAGLHFTHRLIQELKQQGVHFAQVTLHIGLDTFSPVTADRPEEHYIHTEWCQITPDAASTINRAVQQGGRVIAVGTTSVRTLESAAVQADTAHFVEPFEGPTNLFILPGYKFRLVDGLITNFHLPRSTLIMLVSAFAGREKVLHAYQVAKEMKYRFYSFGDAMLII